LILRWAGVDGVDPDSRGAFVDARHLALVEAFFGEMYHEIQQGNEDRTYPGSASNGRAIEGSFRQIVNVLETVFLAQTAKSMIARGVGIEAAIDSPYFFYALLQFGPEEGSPAPASDGNIQMVIELIASFVPTGAGAATTYLTKALLGLEGMVSIAFEGDRAAYATAAMPGLSGVADPVIKEIAASILEGTAIIGSVASGQARPHRRERGRGVPSTRNLTAGVERCPRCARRLPSGCCLGVDHGETRGRPGVQPRRLPPRNDIQSTIGRAAPSPFFPRPRRSERLQQRIDLGVGQLRPGAADARGDDEPPHKSA
jgi:hypothetical protein